MFRFSVGRRAERDTAAAIYAAALAAARRPALYRDYGVSDTLEGRFEMAALHLFPVFHRLMHDPGDDPELARRVSERLVDDMDGALREAGVGDLTVPKRMRKLYGAFAGRISAYGDALKEGPEALAEAISRNVFPDGAEASGAPALSAYLRDATTTIREADLAAIKRGALPFPRLPEVVVKELEP